MPGPAQNDSSNDESELKSVNTNKTGLKSIEKSSSRSKRPQRGRLFNLSTQK